MIPTGIFPPIGLNAMAHYLIDIMGLIWLRGQDSNLRPSGYEPDELPDCSTPLQFRSQKSEDRSEECAAPCKIAIVYMVLTWTDI